MNSRERILQAIQLQTLDRIPTDFWATPEVIHDLKKHLGVNTARELWHKLHVDKIVTISPRYIGPTLASGRPGIVRDYWGIEYKLQLYGTGVYEEMVYHPLGHARTFADVDAYEFPKVEWFDYESLAQSIGAYYPDYAIEVGYSAPFYLFNKLVGLEQSLLMLVENPDLAHYIIGKIVDFFYRFAYRQFEAVDGKADITQVTDDFGCQTGLLISRSMFSEFFHGHYKRLIDLAKEFDLFVFHHDDGACREILPDLIELGIDILNPVQWNCPGMDRQQLEEDFGDSICFHGGVENQAILPFGTEAEVRQEVRACIDLLGPETGYILASCHNIQPITPIENIIAMYDEAFHYGQM
ncbi:MAG: uroporphyrinogen-III decarboxylase-like protein [Firmicutes bacterium]|nr:uroporphyrinogen-III decarboxylase-like protein [Bacillota bacterium]